MGGKQNAFWTSGFVYYSKSRNERVFIIIMPLNCAAKHVQSVGKPIMDLAPIHNATPVKRHLAARGTPLCSNTHLIWHLVTSTKDSIWT